MLPTTLAVSVLGSDWSVNTEAIRSLQKGVKKCQKQVAAVRV